MEQERNKKALHKEPPKEIQECLKALNPYYATHTLAYTENCQRCVVAYEVRRRGYFTLAKPYLGGRADLLPYMDRTAGVARCLSGADRGKLRRPYAETGTGECGTSNAPVRKSQPCHCEG